MNHGTRALFYNEKTYNGILVFSIFDSARAIFPGPSIKTVTSDTTPEDSTFAPIETRSFLTKIYLPNKKDFYDSLIFVRNIPIKSRPTIKTSKTGHTIADWHYIG